MKCHEPEVPVCKLGNCIIVRNHGPGNGDSLLLPAGEIARQSLELMFQSQHVDDLL